MNKLDNAKRAQIVAGIIEGCSVSSIVRMTGASKNTIQKLVIDLGDACSEYMNKHLIVNLTMPRGFSAMKFGRLSGRSRPT